MGLDQYAYAVTEGGENDGEQLHLTDWRKHNRLQGWMEELWEEKGKPNLSDEASPMGDFNCVPLELTSIDIDSLEESVLTKELPETAGFFFGNDSFDWEDENGKPYEEGDYYYKETDIEFIEKARKALEEGKKVFYSSWW